MRYVCSVYGRNGVGVKESCLLRSDGDYIGIDTGTVYSKVDHYHRPVKLARLGDLSHEDPFLVTGMYHLDVPANVVARRKFAGCWVWVEEAHSFGEETVYYAPDLKDYFGSSELEIIESWSIVKVKEVMEILAGVDPEAECIWEDAIEGNDCPLTSVKVINWEEKFGPKENWMRVYKTEQAVTFAP